MIPEEVREQFLPPAVAYSASPKADMIFGASGTRKTTQCGRLARYVFKTHSQKTTRLITADPGGWKPIEPYVHYKIIQPFSLLDDRVNAPIEAIGKLVQGYWPFDPKTGDPIIKKLASGKEVYDFTDKRAMPTAETWKKVGGYCFEGQHSITHLMMQHLTSTPGMLNELAGGAMKRAGEISKIQDGSDTYIQPGQAGYGFVQNKITKLVSQSGALPVVRILWTSLIKLFEKRDKDQNIIAQGPYGPSAAGQETVVLCPQWYGHLLHLDSVTVGIDKEDRPDKARTVSAEKIGFAKEEVRAYLRRHINPKDGFEVPSKARIPEAAMKKVPSYFVLGDGEADLGIDWLYGLEDECNMMANAAVAKDLGLEVAA